MKKINGIQQLGVGVVNLTEAWAWYRKHFGMDIGVFDDKGVAEMMLPVTEGKPRERHAILALNMQGGGGFEVWQHTKHTPRLPAFEILMGDLGINAGKMKTADADMTHAHFKKSGLNLLSDVVLDPAGRKTFWVMDKYVNLWQFVEGTQTFRPEKRNVNGGTYGTVIGVKDMEESLPFYRELLEYDIVMLDEEGVFEDFTGTPGGTSRFRRVLLQHSEQRNGAMSPLYGPSEIELIQGFDREPNLIYHCRLWGDPGFIHLCFDIDGMGDLREEAKEMGFPFMVDSERDMSTFDMGEAAGSFSYIRAPEGTLIEFVESHKLPIIKPLGIYINFQKRGHRPLPRWLLHLFALKRVK